MKDLLRQAVKESNSLDEVYERIVFVIEKVKEEKGGKVGFVSGIVSSDGPKFVERNLARLANFTSAIEKKCYFPVFSANCVFDHDLFDRLDSAGIKNEDYAQMWERLIHSGYITDIFMTPRWEKSRGASNEHKIAKKLGLRIHYVKEPLLEGTL